MKHEHRPPRLLLALFRWFCHPDYSEEIEGDLLEQFQLNADQHGVRRANWLLVTDVLRLLRPEIIVNFHFFTTNFMAMKTKNRLQPVAINLLFALFVILPFLPGPPNKLSIGLMALGQFTGFFGVILLPIGFVWAIVEYQKRWGAPEKLNNWNSGFYFAIAATVCSLVFFALLTVGLTLEAGIWVAVLSVGIGCLVLWKLIPGIKKLRQRTSPSSTPAPFYLLSIPVIALLAKLLLMDPFAATSRGKAIQQSEGLITAIENYRSEKGNYPASLDELQPAYLADIPNPSVMGVKQYLYEKTPDAYNLFFWQHLGATEESVMYSKNNQHNVKGHYAEGEAGAANWRYYWLD